MSDKAPPRHAFTSQTEDVLHRRFGSIADEVYRASPLLGYLNYKTKSANRGSKSRGSFANHYALYVVVEDYIKKGYLPDGKLAGRYSDYDGARFSDLFKRQRELLFGQKLQNHALNTRLNDEFRKFLPSVQSEPIVRDIARQRYWIHEDLISVDLRGKDGQMHRYNLAEAIMDIIETYIATKKESFERSLRPASKFPNWLKKMWAPRWSLSASRYGRTPMRESLKLSAFRFLSLLGQTIFWGWTRDALN
jgi:hypothetical protein